MQQSQEDKPMLKDTLKLSDQKVLDYAREGLQAHLPLHAEGYVCDTHDLLNVLLGVAAQRGTLESVCTDLVGSPNPETIRTYLNEQLCVEDLPKLEQDLNAALAQQIPQRLWRKPREVAIDFHDRPYYGKLSQAEGLWVRGRARDGTTRFYRVASAYVMLNGLRVTLALHFVLPQQDTVTVLQTLLHRVQGLRVHIRRLFLDKGFAGIAVLDYLTRCGQPAVIACPIRGRSGGTRALCQGHQSYRTTHTFKGESGITFTATLAVCRVFTTAKRTQRLKRRAAWLVYILVALDLTPRQVHRLYRRRFGVESSYRSAGQVRGWTTSPNPAYRFVLMGLAFFLRNVWIHLRWLFTQLPRRGQRWLDTQRFQLTRLAKFIVRALEQHYGCVREIVAPAAPRL
jgi:putative transposase